MWLRILCRLLIPLCLLILLVSMGTNLRHVAPSEPECHTLTQRDRHCEYQHLCIGAAEGAFVLGTVSGRVSRAIVENPVNLKAATDIDDIWFHPEFISRPIIERDKTIVWVNRTLIVAAPYSTEHLTHFLLNNLLPAIDIRLRLAARAPHLHHHFDLFYTWNNVTPLATTTSWLGFTEAVIGPDWETHPLVADRGQVVCYARGIIGLNSTCLFDYCDHPHSPEVIPHVRSLLWDHCGFQAPQPRFRPLVHIIQRRGTRRIVNLALMEEWLRREEVDYSVFEMEGVDLCGQAGVFYEADVVVAVHGNSLGHMLWMRQGTAVIELNSLGWHSDFFLQVAAASAHLGFFHQISCRSTSCLLKGEDDLDPKHRAIVIDTDVWRETFAALRLLTPP